MATLLARERESCVGAMLTYASGLVCSGYGWKECNVEDDMGTEFTKENVESLIYLIDLAARIITDISSDDDE